MAVIGVLAEAHVGDHDQLGRDPLDLPDRLLHNAAARVALRARGPSSPADRTGSLRDAQLGDLADLRASVSTIAGSSRHRPDLAAHTHPWSRTAVDEVIRRDARLAHQAPDALRPSQPAASRLGVHMPTPGPSPAGEGESWSVSPAICRVSASASARFPAQGVLTLTSSGCAPRPWRAPPGCQGSPSSPAGAAPAAPPTHRTPARSAPQAPAGCAWPAQGLPHPC